MNKVIIVGSSGAGKSTFAIQLQEKTNLPLFHLDKLFWKPGWILSSKEEQITIQKKVIEKEQWIIDGNYGDTLDLRITACDTIIFIDPPRTVCLYQVLKRNKMYKNSPRPDMNEGCPEKVDWDFLKWTWHFKNTQRVALIKKLNNVYREKNIVILKSRKEVNNYLKD